MIAGVVGSATGPGWIWNGTASIKGSSDSMRMALLTAALVGIQFTWGIEMTYCTPYLLKLGLTKSRVSLIWVAGPLSGLIMQPVIGVIADRSTSPYGRRRPYMIIGTATVCLSLLLLGWTAEVVGMFTSDVSSVKSLTVFLAVLSIYGIDFAINAVQASTRSMIVDVLPSSKQQLGSAWGSRMVAIGHLLGYAVGAIDLTTIFGNSLGDTQFKQLIIVSMLTLIGTVGLTCWAVEERVLVSTGADDEEVNIKKMMHSLIVRAMNLPPRKSTICWIQFYSWIGWFPFLFYSSTWIGEVYMRFNAGGKEHHDTLAQIGRVGSTSLVAFSTVTLISSVVVPLLISNPEESTSYFTPRPPAAIADLLLEVQKYKPTMLTAWTYSHIVFAGTMVCTPFVTSLFSATILIALCGIPWAMQCWAPFAILGAELSAGPKDIEGEEVGNKQRTEDDPHQNESKNQSHGASETGVHLAILNLYTIAPQFISTFISSAIFSILEPGKSPELARDAHPDEHHSTDGLNAISICLFIGALSAVLASYETNKLKIY